MTGDYELLQTRPSRVHGLGCYTSDKISKGEVAATWRGQLVSTPAQPGEQYYGYYVMIGDRWLLPRESPEIHINHSCEPNTVVRILSDGLEFVAVKDIERNEELSFDYGTVIAEGDTFMFHCSCGKENCRKIVRAPTRHV